MKPLLLSLLICASVGAQDDTIRVNTSDPDTLRWTQGDATIKIYHSKDGQTVWYCDSGIVIDGGGGALKEPDTCVDAGTYIDPEYWEKIPDTTLRYIFTRCYNRIPERWECVVDTVVTESSICRVKKWLPKHPVYLTEDEIERLRGILEWPKKDTNNVNFDRNW